MIISRVPLFLASIVILFGAKTALGAGSGNGYAPPEKKPFGYNETITLIAAEKYYEVIQPLKSAENLAKAYADIQNLLGFTHRKIGKLDAAASYYNRALEINPQRKGALEYQGELFLMLGDKDAAIVNLAKLDKVCWLGCVEYVDLEQAIAETQ